MQVDAPTGAECQRLVQASERPFTFAEEIGADGFAKDAAPAAVVAQELLA